MDESLVTTAVLLTSFAAFIPLINAHSQYREAFEEIALDITSPHLRTVVTLPPFLSSKKLIVTPIVGLLTDPSVISTLVPCRDEVDLIFDHPVKAFLDPSIIVGENLVPIGSEQWKWPSELHVWRHLTRIYESETQKALCRISKISSQGSSDTLIGCIDSVARALRLLGSLRILWCVSDMRRPYPLTGVVDFRRGGGIQYRDHVRPMGFRSTNSSGVRTSCPEKRS